MDDELELICAATAELEAAPDATGQRAAMIKWLRGVMVLAEEAVGQGADAPGQLLLSLVEKLPGGALIRRTDHPLAEARGRAVAAVTWLMRLGTTEDDAAAAVALAVGVKPSSLQSWRDQMSGSRKLQPAAAAEAEASLERWGFLDGLPGGAAAVIWNELVQDRVIHTAASRNIT